METLQGMSLSAAALKLMKSYYKELAIADMATTEEKLTAYSAQKLGGFKDRRKDRETGEMVPFDLLTKQKQAMAWLDANGNNGVCALDTGIGKCVREDTLITTDRGLVPIRELNPGLTEPDTTAPVEGSSVVVGGKVLPIKNFYFGGSKPTIRVTTRRGYEVEGSRVHPLLVRTPDGHEAWVQTPELVAGDFLCVERSEGRFSEEDPVLSVPVSEDFQQASRNPDKTFTDPHLRVFPVPDRMSPEMGRLLGYIVAEGWTNHRRFFTISQCPEKNPEVRADIEQLLREQLGWEAKPDKDIYIASLFLREYLSRMGVGMGVAKDKTVPSVIFRSSRETIRQFIRALVDAEGSVKGEASCIEFTTASEQLGRELQVLLLHFGVLCTRSPKKVKGYDHTYWRITVTGEDAQIYWDTIGFVSRRKQAAFKKMPDARNTNLDVVPYMAARVGALFDAGLVSSGLSVSRVREQQGNSFDITVCHIRRGRRNPTYTFLQNLLSWSADYGCQSHPAFKALEETVGRHLFYDPIEKMEESEAVVMDIEVDDPSHCFIGNGLVNHNTLTSIGMMQKLIRDGLTDEDASYTRPDGKEVTTNGRFLYVCPNSLKGNPVKEIKAFLKAEDSTILLQKLDVISYREFSGSGKSRKVPRGLRGVQFWKGRKWEPALYVSIFFDEAHKLKNISSGASQAALKTWHPRKVCLTASPMEKQPMEAYVLAAISNNTPLFGKTLEARENRKEMRRFKERFCETIGRRIVGVKQDPLVKRDLQTWVKRNIFYADKQDVEEFELPKLDTSTVAVQMPEQVEETYRDITGQFSSLMGGLVAKFRDRGLNEAGPNARDPSLERVFGMAFRPLVKLLSVMANYPDVAMLDIATMIETDNWPYPNAQGEYLPVPKVLRRALNKWKDKFDPAQLRADAEAMGNPKLEQAELSMKQKLERSDGSSRTLLFTDDKRFCMMSARHMAKRIAGKHAVALNDRILILDGGAPVTEVEFEIDPKVLRKLVKDPDERKRIRRETKGVSRLQLPFTKRALRRHPEIPAHPVLNPHFKAADWQQFVFKEVIGPDQGIRSLTLHGPTYQYGHNLQAFDTVVHLDRDNWNSESMKQRTARAWRQGQEQPVDEIVIDATYSASDDGTPRPDFDRTLDEIRRYFQQLDGSIFDRIIKDAQGVELGKEWAELAAVDSSLLKLDKQVLELMGSPYVSRSAPPGE